MVTPVSIGFVWLGLRHRDASRQAVEQPSFKAKLDVGDDKLKGKKWLGQVLWKSAEKNMTLLSLFFSCVCFHGSRVAKTSRKPKKKF